MNNAIVNCSNRAVLMVKLSVPPEGDVSGAFLTPCLREAVSFVGLDQFLLLANRLFDQQNFPQRGLAKRSFLKQSKGGEEAFPLRETPLPQDQLLQAFSRMAGQLALTVHVYYRQNASWQGGIRWMGTDREQHFRSALELIELMSEAVELCRSKARCALEACAR